MEHKTTFKLLALTCISLSGCTVINVKPVEKNTNDVNAICIEENKAVKKDGFLPMIEERLTAHQISSQRYIGTIPQPCVYTLHYVAHWNWDLAVYLTDADIAIRKGGDTIGQATYHLKNKGGLALSKFASAESKMVPLLDQLLEQFPRTP
ncbi:MAG: Sbal_3080 family lipoprotein [Steroidobacteraceae bacterium]